VTAIGARRHNHNHNIMRTGAASAVRVRCHNDNDDTMTIAGLWSYGAWRHVATGCTALVVNYNNLKNDNVIVITRMWAMPNVMAALPNIGGALCSTPQSLAGAHSY